MTSDSDKGQEAADSDPIPADDNVAIRRLWTYGGVTLILFIVFLVSRGSSWRGSTELHTIMEVLAATLALTVGVQALVHYYTNSSGVFLMVGVGFVGTGLLDAYHALVTSSWFAHLNLNAPDHLIPWSWVASRLFLSLCMAISVAVWFQERRNPAWILRDLTTYIGGAFLLLLSFAFFIFFPLPAAYYPSLLTPRPEEFVPAILFLIALIGYYLKGQWRHDHFEHWLVISLIVGFLSQAMFMSFSGTLFDADFDLAHLLKKVSYLCVLVGLMISMFSLFEIANKNKRSLELMVAERTAQLESTNTELEQFSYVASHDLQEPLRKLISFSQLLRTDLDAVDLSEDAEKDIEFIVDAAERMQSLVRDLLWYSRTREERFRPSEVDLEGLADTVLEDLSLLFEERGVELQRAPLPVVTGDAVMLGQLLQNLISNAVKFSGDEPRVEITSEEIAGDLVIGVRDHGIGIDPGYREQIFQPFRRLHTRREYPGSGIGLAICAKVIALHRGRLWVEENPSGGSHFRFTIPLNQ